MPIQYESTKLGIVQLCIVFPCSLQNVHGKGWKERIAVGRHGPNVFIAVFVAKALQIHRYFLFAFQSLSHSPGNKERRQGHRSDNKHGQGGESWTIDAIATIAVPTIL
jgi:hypothetical protein